RHATPIASAVMARSRVSGAGWSDTVEVSDAPARPAATTARKPEAPKGAYETRAHLGGSHTPGLIIEGRGGIVGSKRERKAELEPARALSTICFTWAWASV